MYIIETIYREDFLSAPYDFLAQRFQKARPRLSRPRPEAVKREALSKEQYK